MGVKFKNRKNQKGLAIIETLPILIIFILLLGYGLGFFGVVHTGILNSIASRTYAFETFRNRADLSYFRDRPSGPKTLFVTVGNRVHGINDESKATTNGTAVEGAFATTRRLDFRQVSSTSGATQEDHNQRVFDIVGRNRQGGVEASPVWVMISYGICLDAGCGD